MEPFTVHRGRAVPLRRSNVDTDQIIPAVFLKRISRSGFADGLFAAWRAEPDFVLNRPEYDGGSILVAGPDFGIGSSREHAVWALRDYGFRAVLSSRFGDIFRSNALRGGLLAAVLDQQRIEDLWALIEREPGLTVTVDLHAREVWCRSLITSFDIDDYAQRRLLEGLDDIDLTMRHADAIASYEAARPPFMPRTLQRG